MRDVLKITFLGTGTPAPSPQAFGTATAIEVGGSTLLLDCGRGAVIRLAQAGIPLGAIDAIFFSHFHSDHYAALPDLLMSGAIPRPWAGRKQALPVYGPSGIHDVVAGVRLFTKADREIRIADREILPESHEMIVHEFTDGVIFEKNGLKVTAIEVDHGEFVRPAFAFRIDFAGRSFVHSHDTRYCERLIEKSRGVDVMVHEVAAVRRETLEASASARIMMAHHASPADVGRALARVKPRLALLTHLILGPPNPPRIEDVIFEISDSYDGTVLFAEDMMRVFIADGIQVVPCSKPGP